MGSYAGHADEAIIFIILGLWWIYNGFPDYIRTCWHKKEFKCQPSYTWPNKPKFPIESIVKILFPVAGFLAEVFIDGPHFVDKETNRWIGLNHLQHMAIYGMFALHGIIDIIRHWGAPLPRGFVTMSMALCFFWYGLSFVFHVRMKGKEGMETLIHYMPTYVLFGVSLALVMETFKPTWFLTFMARTFGVLMLGTWFWHTADMMYLARPFPGTLPNPAWDRKDIRNVHFLVALFGYHLILNLVAVTVLYLVTYLVLRLRGDHQPRYKQLPQGPEDVNGSLINGKYL